MRRCPDCDRPNSGTAPACVHCGAVLPAVPKAPFWTWGDFWQSGAALFALGSALAVTALRMGLGRALAVSGGGRDEGAVLFFHVTLALACGLAVGHARLERDGLNSVWVWLAAAALGGLLSFGLDFLYNYQRLVYRLVWYSLEFFYPDRGSASAERAYGLLQVLRFLGPVLCLGAVYAYRVRRPALRLLGLLWLALALGSRFRVRGAFLSYGEPGWAHVITYALSVFFVVYGLSPRPEEARPAP